MAEPKKKAIIQANVLALLKEYDGKYKMHLRVVTWTVDGVQSSAKLEKRSFFKNKNGTFSDLGSAKGLDREDIEFVIANWQEISLFFR